MSNVGSALSPPKSSVLTKHFRYTKTVHSYYNEWEKVQHAWRNKSHLINKRANRQMVKLLLQKQPVHAGWSSL